MAKRDYELAVNLGAKLDKTFGKTMGSANKELSGLNKTAAAIGGGLKKVGAAGLKVAGAGIAAMAAAGVAAGGAILKIGSDYQEDFKTIANGTGATGAALEGLVESYRKVGAATDENLADTAAVIADLNTRLGLTGPPLESMAGAIMDLGDIAKEDFAAISSGSARMMNAFQIAGEEGAAMLDKVWVASQSTGIGVTELMGKLTDQGAAFRTLGLDIDTSIAMLSTWEKNGLNVSTMMSGMNLAAKNLAKKGVKDMGKGLTDVFAKIKGAPSDAKAAKIALDMFGKSGVAMADAIRSGAMEIDGLMEALQGSGGAIEANAAATETLAEKFATLKNKAVTALQPLAGTLMDKVGGAIEGAMPVVEKLLGKLPGIFDKIMPLFAGIADKLPAIIDGAFSLLEPLLAGAGDMFTELLPSFEALFSTLSDAGGPVLAALIPALVGLVPLFGDLVRGLSPFIREGLTLVSQVITPLIPMIMELARDALPIVMAALSAVFAVLRPVIPVLMNMISAVLPPVSTLLGKIGEALVRLSPLFEVLGAVVGTTLQSAFETALPAITGIMDALGHLLDFWSNVFSGNWQAAWDSLVAYFGAAWGSLVELVKAPLRHIITMVNNMISGLNGLSIPDWVPGLGGKSLNIPLIPMLAKGTDAFMGGLAIVGERGPELVNMPRGSQVTPAQRTEELLAAGEGGGGIQVNYNPQYIIQGNVDDDTMDKLRQHSKLSLEELERMLKELRSRGRRVAFA